MYYRRDGSVEGPLWPHKIREIVHSKISKVLILIIGPLSLLKCLVDLYGRPYTGFMYKGSYAWYSPGSASVIVFMCMVRP